jgi:four helix bundle protein
LQNNRGPGNHENTVAGFEKLWVWQEAHKLMQEIHTFCRTLPKTEDYKLRDQIERCSSSVCDNIAEGYSAYYYKVKIKGFYIARKEAGETQDQIHKLSGKNYLNLE